MVWPAKHSSARDVPKWWNQLWLQQTLSDLLQICSKSDRLEFWRPLPKKQTSDQHSPSGTVKRDCSGDSPYPSGPDHHQWCSRRRSVSGAIADIQCATCEWTDQQIPSWLRQWPLQPRRLSYGLTMIPLIKWCQKLPQNKGKLIFKCQPSQSS